MSIDNGLLELDAEIDDCEGEVVAGVLTLQFTEHNVVVKIDRETLDEHDLIPRRLAEEHCGHDLDASYDAGYSAGRGEFNLGAAGVMEAWHNEHHAGVFRLCYEEPCKALRAVQEYGE